MLKLLVLVASLGSLLVLSKGSRSLLSSSEGAKQKEKLRSSSKSSYDVCIVGAGLSGAVIAERYASVLKKSVLVLEKRDHIGGNCYDYVDEETGIRVSRFGAHLFHTVNRRVWDYVHRFSDWTPYEHTVLGLVEGKHVPIPVNIDTVNMLFDLKIKDSTEMDEWLKKEQVHYDHEPKNSEEMALSRVGPRLYDWIFKPYTFKQWARYPAELGPEVTARIPVRNNYDNRYFSDPYQALPTKGYTAIFEKLLDSPRIEVRTNTDYFEVKDTIKCGRLYYTGPVDTYFAHLGWPKLEYRSLDFERVVKKDTDYFQPASVVNHPQASSDFTRIVEYKHLLNQTSPHTIYFVERSKDGGEPYYPVPNEKNQELYRRYQKMAAKEKDVTFVGRLANYKYFNMDEAILNALELFDKDTGTPEKDQWTDKGEAVAEKKLRGTEENIDANNVAPPVLEEKTKEKIVTPMNKKTKDNQKTHWCIISKDYSMKIDPEWFVHFPHACEVILPCWSWFRRRNAESNCGFVLMDGLKFNDPNPNSWQQELVTTMGCKVKEMDSALSPDGFPLSADEIQHVPNLSLIRPRYNQRIYVERPEDAHALRRLVIPDSLIEERKGNGKPMQIGLVQRTRSRVITNLDEIQSALQAALPDANLTQSKLEFSFREQAEFFATQDVIIAAHGAGLTNALFMTPGTVVLQLYPKWYFYQSLDPLIEQVGGIAIDWFVGDNPIRDWFWARRWFMHKWSREYTITPPPEEIVGKVLRALGKIRTSADDLALW
jgi:UDP-galactopyranose mutase